MAEDVPRSGETVTQPPPHGWYQQQPPQQGWQQPPPSWQPHPHRPKKSKAAIIAVVIIVVLLLLAGLGTGGFFFLHARRDQGYPQRGDALPELCGSVSAQMLAKARTTNPDGPRSSQPDGNTTNCHWQQTEGRDNPGNRSLYVKIWQGEGKFSSALEMVSVSRTATTTVSDVNGIGDEAKSVTTVWPHDVVDEYALVARKGDHTVIVEYSGSDPGLFSATKPDLNEFGEIAKAIMNDVLGKL